MSGVPINEIVAMIKAELGLPSGMTMLDVIAQGMSLVGMDDNAGTMTLKDKAVCVARELNIATTKEEKGE